MDNGAAAKLKFSAVAVGAAVVLRRNWCAQVLLWQRLGALCLLGMLGTAGIASAADSTHQIPDEYETTSGYGVAMNNAGYAANDSFSAIRANPALLAAQKTYTVNAGYHWPVAGRDYFQAGIVDAKTSSVAAGLSYTGFSDSYQPPSDPTHGVTGAAVNDSPIIRRGILGLAQTFGSMALGIGATYVEANPLAGTPAFERGAKEVSGLGMNAGAAASIGPGWSAGASIENASNTSINDYAPRTIGAGVAYQPSPGISAMLDARQRDRVAAFEDTLDIEHPNQKSALMRNPERMVIGSMSALVESYLRLTGSYGQSITDSRRSLAGGIAVVGKSISLSYTAARPYMQDSGAHQALTFTLDTSM